MNLTQKLLALALLIGGTSVTAQITERTTPKEWDNLVIGGRFMDRFLPMPNGKKVYDTWGAKNVIPRFEDNGIEVPHLSFWGGNILQTPDKKYHLLVCGWLESAEKGHMEWPNSIVYHSVSNKLHGPYQIVDTIGYGHNPETYRLKDGRYVLSVSGAYYIADDINGPWEKSSFKYDTRNRPIIEGLTNQTYAPREDGSVMMVCRGGGTWISQDGISPYQQITVKRIYPDVPGEFEDPVVWRDDFQYHLIVNDWLGRIAYYQRSPDGVHWVTEEGQAYVPGISKHKDGHVEDWFKYERIKVFQDDHGRVLQANFAVIDTIKWNDLGSDNHSSKNLCIPMNKGLLLSIENQEPINANTPTITLRIKGEKGFNPSKDLNLESLRLGNFTEVNYGRGAEVISSKKDGKDLLVTFNGKNSGITEDEFAPKLLGKDKKGEMVFGYAKLPYYNYTPAILSSLRPTVESGDQISVTIKNFGLSKSKPASIKVLCNDVLIAEGNLKALNSYEEESIVMSSRPKFTEPEGCTYKVEFYIDGKKVETNTFK